GGRGDRGTHLGDAAHALRAAGALSGVLFARGPPEERRGRDRGERVAGRPSYAHSAVASIVIAPCASRVHKRAVRFASSGAPHSSKGAVSKSGRIARKA